MHRQAASKLLCARFLLSKSLRPALNSLCGSRRPRTLSCLSLRAIMPELLNASSERALAIKGAGTLTLCHHCRTWALFSLFLKNKTIKHFSIVRLTREPSVPPRKTETGPSQLWQGRSLHSVGLPAPGFLTSFPWTLRPLCYS